MDNFPLRILDDPERGTIVEKLTEVVLRDWKHMKELLDLCEAQRQIGETLLNEMSSRSHQILRLTIESSAQEFLGKDNSSTLAASVNFVDLAGSERASQALSVGNRLKEGCHINRSLLTLGTVIRKLSKGRNGHIPYRDSKLTRILQPSLGGNARTAIICTMCPARSHIEQSRNTLLFASCAKEVMTSARVNVVMSDKTLVKHLQKELARLESELRYPGTNSSTSNYEALLREKDAQIKKMEKEIKELVHQRDMAQSRVEDLLQVVGSSRHSSQWEESCQISRSDIPKLSEELLATSTSSVSYQGPGFGFTKPPLYNGDNKNENPKVHSISSPRLAGSVQSKYDLEVAHDNIEDTEDVCKDVRCIEMDGPVRTGDSSSPNHEQNEQVALRPPRLNPKYITLEQHLQDVRERLSKFVKAYPDESSQWTPISDLSTSRGLMLSRSRSCRETLMKDSSPWFQEAEPNDSTPSSHKDLTERTQRFQRRCRALNYGVIGTPSREGTETFERSTCNSVLEEESVTSESKGGITTIHDFVAGLKMAQVQYQNQLTGDQEAEHNATQDTGVGITTRGIGLDPILDPIESPSRWPLEFEKKQQEIIVLWHACNVSLVHRTYFFLLFKGDPMDSIYMEVELRRLSFVKRMVALGNLDMKSAEGGNLVSSTKKIRREREMLCRQMHRRYTSEERESLYTKWGITLDSKQRKLQLVRRLWTDTKDLEHVRESATIVAKLIGLLETGQALKEMFGLSFSPDEQYNRRSTRWRRYSVSSFK
ncbi:kinesin-like protein KIN-7F isoform X2 [Iris pallida]|uniref:Kinesin-like protein n=1 Tax=Iris pallida TaxID=29817 RepID=A0AAX6GZD8_IRIPA|nr:kinesin-like protein KIN-7F isoform X2 [Iris pallida]